MRGTTQKLSCLLCLVLTATVQSLAQRDYTHTTIDSLTPIAEVTVNGYGQQLPARLTPAAISVIDSSRLAQYNDASVLQAVNTVPGVRMEERSPGSYRLGIRGSALEAPFGVRNVKVYYNGIPFTEPGGTTYLAALGVYNFSSLEIIKGPGSSLYGAGTGGVLLINSQPLQWQQGATISATGGSYGLLSLAAEASTGDSTFRNTIRYQHLQSDGYRAQSGLRRDVASWDAMVKHSASTSISTHFLYSDLWYQTPGALTQKEYDATPDAARPGTATAPGAVAAQAAIFQKTLLAGFDVKQEWGSKVSTTATLYGAYISQDNPNVRNYSRVSLPYFGGRGMLQYNDRIGRGAIQWIVGAELQQGFNRQQVYGNNNGSTANLQTDGEVDSRQYTGFTQLTYRLPTWVFTAGLSLNNGRTDIRLFGANPLPAQGVDYTTPAPRFTALKSLSRSLAVFASIAKGFTPPSADALAPTGSAVNTSLAPEKGWDYEAGIRGNAFGQRLSFDATAFYFRLSDAIVPRRDSAGGDYYSNAGSTDQKGFELALRYAVLQTMTHQCEAWISYTAQQFHYATFRPLDKDYSGNKFPGVAPNTIAAGLSATAWQRVSASISYFYSDAIPLNDANTANADAYHLVSAKVNYGLVIRRFRADIFAGVDNLLNSKYSLGNDLNAVNSRYYNAAPLRSFYAGLRMRYAR